jgi:hypothetical protein
MAMPPNAPGVIGTCQSMLPVAPSRQKATPEAGPFVP